MERKISDILNRKKLTRSRNSSELTLSVPNLNLDQKEKAKLFKNGQSQMSKIESGRSVLTIQMLTRIKRLAEENDYLRENLSWEWSTDGKGRGIIG